MYTFISLICPLITLITGYLLKSFPPKNINSSAGYRTQMSKKNIETWNKANKYSTKLLINFSWMSALITLISSPILGKSYIVVGVFLSIILLIISVITIVMLTERHLKNMFGE